MRDSAGSSKVPKFANIIGSTTSSAGKKIQLFVPGWLNGIGGVGNKIRSSAPRRPNGSGSGIRPAEYGQRRWQDPDFRTNRAEYRRQRPQTDPNFRLGNALRTRIWMALKHNWKSGHTLELLGCTIDHLWDHLEHQFQPGMTRANMGKIWHIDHCRPCASFDLTDPAQQRECFGFMNLQPLFSAENLGKHAKPETEEQFVDRTERYWRIAA